jgi:voltage-gated potassium channel
MAHIDPDQVGDVRSSPPSDLEALLRLAPVALALLGTGDLAETYASLKQDVRKAAKDDPIDALLVTVVGGGIAFYLAERDTNPACRSPLDGILYLATCLSVGYDNLFPTTTAGHALASAAQTFGPALANMAFDAPAAVAAAAADAAADVNRQILARLDDIVRLLEAKA